MCLFVSSSLEAAADLTSLAFLAAFRRYVETPGVCTKLLSDNGCNFYESNKELRRIILIMWILEYFIEVFSKLRFLVNSVNKIHFNLF